MSQTSWESAVEAVGCVCVNEDSVQCAAGRKMRQVACGCRCHATLATDVIDGRKALNWLKTGWYGLPTETEHYAKLEESLEDSEKRSNRQAEELAELKRMRQWQAPTTTDTVSDRIQEMLDDALEAQWARGENQTIVNNERADITAHVLECAIAALEAELTSLRTQVVREREFYQGAAQDRERLKAALENHRRFVNVVEKWANDPNAWVTDGQVKLALAELKGALDTSATPSAALSGDDNK